MHQIDKQKLRAWIEDSSSSEIRRAKQKLAENINFISSKQFLGTLKKLVYLVNREISLPYAFLWDYKPHASKRWVFHKAKHLLTEKPKITTYFTPAAENILKVLPNILNKGINSIVILDDACYSGEQLINKSIKPICKFFTKNKRQLKLIIAIPYITTIGLKRLKEVIDLRNSYVSIKVLYIEHMPSILEILNKDEIKILNQHSKTRGISEFSYMGSTLTYFSHRVADDHSFSEEFSRFINKDKKVYGDNDSAYSRKEKKEWDKYWRVWVKHVKGED